MRGEKRVNPGDARSGLSARRPTPRRLVVFCSTTVDSCLVMNDPPYFELRLEFARRNWLAFEVFVVMTLFISRSRCVTMAGSWLAPDASTRAFENSERSLFASDRPRATSRPSTLFDR